jgi:cytochrome P450
MSCPFGHGGPQKRAAQVARHVLAASPALSTSIPGVEVPFFKEEPLPFSAFPRANHVTPEAYAQRAHFLLEELHDQLGDSFVLTVPNGNEVLFVRGAKTVREVVLAGDYEKTWDSEAASVRDADYVANLVQPILTKTIFSFNSEENAPRRKCLRPVVLYAEQYNEAIGAAIDEDLPLQFPNLVKGGPAETGDVLEFCHSVIRKNILAACCGDHVAELSYHHLPVFSEVLDFFVERYSTAELHPSVSPEDVTALKRLETVGRAIVSDFFAKGYETNYKLPCVITAMHEGGFKQEEIAATIINLMIAGAEAPSSMLAFALEELANNPEVQDKLAAEIAEKCGEGNVVPHVNDMPYLEGCVRESMRLFAPATLVQRQAAKEGLTVDGISVPYGTVVGMCVTAIHLDPKQFPEPKKFIPGRPQNKYEILGQDSCLMTFGSGPRGCPGRHVAANILRIFMAKVMQKYKLTPAGPRPSQDEMVPKFIGWAKKGIPVNFELR